MKKIFLLFIALTAFQCTGRKCFAQMMMPTTFKDTLELSGYIDSLYHADSFSGIVAIAKGNRFIYKHFAGFSDKEERIAVSENTIFDVGSITKMFTGVAVMQLVEQNKIQLTDPVSKYLPDFPDKVWSGKATIQNLLSHTSGMGEFFPRFNEFKNFYNLQEIVDTIARIVPTNEPSGQMIYSNAGFYLLGKIVEKVTGKNYFDYVQKYVFDVAGMKNTYFKVPTGDKRFAKGYIIHAGTQQYETNENVINQIGSPAGGTFTNISDLLAFQIALKSNTLLSEKYFKKMTALAVNGQRGMGYGLGIGVGIMPNGAKWIGHNGGAPGIAANYAWFTDTDYSIIVFINKDAKSNMPCMFKCQLLVSEMK